MQQYPTANKIDSRSAEEQHHLGYQYQPYKIYIFTVDTSINDSLRKKREYELQYATQE